MQILESNTDTYFTVVTRNLKEELKVTSTGFAELTELRSAADLSNKQLLEYKERVLIMQVFRLFTLLS